VHATPNPSYRNLPQEKARMASPGDFWVSRWDQNLSELQTSSSKNAFIQNKMKFV
jgi:hypothetical protein